MERGREYKTGASGTRRPRVSGPKDPSDEEARIDEAPPLERAKKEKIGTFHVSVSLPPTVTDRRKKKRHGLQEAQALLGRIVCADESTEETKLTQSEEDEDDPPLLPPPVFKQPGKPRTKWGMKEDEIVMDIPTIPRKARSASSRFSSALRRRPESLSADTPWQQAPTASQQRSPSPSLHAKPGKRLKQAGTKIRPMKDLRVSGATIISDQEVEVAEALFDLARSIPSHVQASESTFEQTPDMKPEEEGFASSSFQVEGNTASIHLQNVIHPAAEDPERKRPRVASRQDEDIPATSSEMVAVAGGSFISLFNMAHSSIVETNQACPLETCQRVAIESFNRQNEPLKGEVVTGLLHGGPQLHGGAPEVHGIEDRNVSGLEQRSKKHARKKAMEENVESNVDTQETVPVQDDMIVKSPAIPKCEVLEHVSSENSENPELSGRITEVQDAKDTSSKTDLMAPPSSVSLKGKGGSDIQSDNGNHAPLKSSSVIFRSHPAKASQVNTEKVPKEHKGIGVLETEIKDGNGLFQEAADGWNQNHLGQKSRPLKEELQSRGLMDDEKEKDAMSPGLSKDQKAASVMPIFFHESSASVCLPVSLSSPQTHISSSTPVALAGWMGGFPPPGFYGGAAPPWPPSASLSGSSIDGKTSHPVTQLPHAAILPCVPRMKHCATHVYLAHYIQQEKQRSQPALPQGAPYNISTPPASLHAKEQCNGRHADLTNVSTQQSGPAHGYTVSQSIGSGIPSNSGSLNNLNTRNGIPGSSHSTNAVSVGAGTGTGTAPGNVVTMAAHAQYLQAMMQQNGFAPLAFPFNGPPCQGASFFSNPFYPAHLIPSVPHFQSLAQQASHLLPLPAKPQQGLHSLPHTSLSQALSPPAPAPAPPHPHPQQQQQQMLQLHLDPKASQQQQQQHYMATSLHHLAAGSEEDATLEGQSHSTAENKVFAMQRNDQDGTMLGGKQSIKPHQKTHFQGQQAPSLSSSVHQQKLTIQNPGPGAGLKMKRLDPSLSEGYSSLGMPSMDRSTLGPGQLDLVASVVATKVHPGFSGASENARVHVQQQQSLGSQNYQRSLPRVTETLLDESYPNKERDSVEEKKSSMKQGGGLFNLEIKDVEVRFPSGLGSSTSGGGATAQAVNNSTGRSSNLATVTGARIPSSPDLQNQIPKQAMARAKYVSGTHMSPETLAAAPAYMEKIPVLGKGLPFPGQTAPSSQGIVQGQAGTITASQRPGAFIGSSLSSKNQGQQAPSNLQAAPLRMPCSGSALVQSSGTLSLSTSHTPSASKVAGLSTSKNLLSVKGIVPATQSGLVSVNRSTVGGPTLSSVMGLGQNMSAKVPVQSKIQGQVAQSQFSQQQSTTSQLGTKHQLHHSPPPQQGTQYQQSFNPQSQHRPQLFFHQQQQFVQHQQTLPLQMQQPSTQSSSCQQLHLQQQLHSVPLSVTRNGGTSSNIVSGTGLPGITNISSSSVGSNHEHQQKFQGSGARACPPLGANSPVSSVASKTT